MTFDTKAISELIKNRRSIYPVNYSGKEVDNAIIEEMLENANWAPTHKFTEPWRFTVFTGEGLKKLAMFQADLYKQKALAKGNYEEKKFNMLSTKPLLASHVIAVGMKRDVEERIPENEEISAVACAVHNMHLTATAYGVGAYWGSGGITYLDEAKAFFGLTSSDKLLGFFFVGTPKGDWPKGHRKSISRKITWVKD